MLSRFQGRMAVLCLAMACAIPAGAQPERRNGDAEPIPTIEDRTRGFRKIDGFFPLYWDERGGRLFLEIPKLDTEVLYSTGLASGLGSNDIGLDRGMLTGSRIVRFERTGPRVLMVQPNYQFRAHTDNQAEARTVRDAFARSVLFGFSVAAATAERVLVDYTEYLVRDGTDMASRLRPGTYRFESSRSSVYLPMTTAFPKNTEMEAELTFVRQPAGAGGPGGGGPAGGPGGGRGGAPGGFFEGVASVAANPEAASVRIHHSIVELPDEDYRPRRFDPRSGFLPLAYEDYAALPGQPMKQRFIRRHRLQKKDPSAPVSEPVKPIVYFLDPGAPEPIRSALLEGARWWNQAFEAAGYRNAFQVEMLPEGASPLDIRYNVINWVHRSTRGWSTGASVTDPRTGEIIKGVVTLGSLRIRQDYMIAEGLLTPYKTGTETPQELMEWGLARIRQLSAHEVGHTLGIGHNYYDSEAGRISVMDYPHPLVTLRPDGSLDSSQVYATGIGDWDRIAVRYGYQDFPAGTDEPRALAGILEEGHKQDLWFLSNQDLGAHPRVDQWSNGTDTVAELERMMEVRRVALSRFGEQAIKLDEPMATLEEVLVPLYLHHRYQLEAAASTVGGIYFTYAMRGENNEPVRYAPAADQRSAVDALLAALKPSELALPPELLKKIPPRPWGYETSRELFPRNTGQMFDAITPAIVAADLVAGLLFDEARAARLVEQHAIDPSMPGLGWVLDRVLQATTNPLTTNSYEAEIGRAVHRVVIERLMTLASDAGMPQVRALATGRLLPYRSVVITDATNPVAAHRASIAADVRRFLDRPQPPASRLEVPQAPPGAPIGEPALDWLRRVAPPCSWID
ncbi:MAG TPA: zinc-dependent metalloprotease [Vicinamibacterales bacterium]|nr:zinc-dependent metalloprotease [Vicinamibacterales bacterium]